MTQELADRLAQSEADVRDVCRKYSADLAHGEHVRRLGEALFDAFAPQHGLGAGERTLLGHAALLHDVGYFVAARGHHRHGAYIVRHDARLQAYPAPERALLAALVRRHRKRVKAPPPGWSRARRRTLLWLCALLRAADALDYDHRQLAEIAAAGCGAGGCEIGIRGLDPSALGERLRRRAALLGRLLGGPVQFRERGR